MLIKKVYAYIFKILYSCNQICHLVLNSYFLQCTVQMYSSSSVRYHQADKLFSALRCNFIVFFTSTVICVLVRSFKAYLRPCKARPTGNFLTLYNHHSGSLVPLVVIYFFIHTLQKGTGLSFH